MLSSNKNIMQVETIELGDKTDAILQEAKNILMSNGGELIGDEEIKMRICYKIRETDRKNYIVISLNRICFQFKHADGIVFVQ
jgi:hypothetical protein